MKPVESADDIIIPESEIPPHLQEQQYDSVLIYAEKDREKALKFKDLLEKFIRLETGRYARICVLDRGENIVYISSKFKHLEDAVKRSTYMFLFMSNNFVKDSWAELQGEECLQESISTASRKWCVIPIHALPRNSSNYNVPFGLRALKGVHCDRILKDQSIVFDERIKVEELKVSDIDDYFVVQMTKLFNIRICEVNKREKEQEKAKLQWLKEERIRRYARAKKEQTEEQISAALHEKKLTMIQEASKVDLAEALERHKQMTLQEAVGDTNTEAPFAAYGGNLRPNSTVNIYFGRVPEDTIESDDVSIHRQNIGSMESSRDYPVDLKSGHLGGPMLTSKAKKEAEEDDETRRSRNPVEGEGEVVSDSGGTVSTMGPSRPHDNSSVVLRSRERHTTPKERTPTIDSDDDTLYKRVANSPPRVDGAYRRGRPENVAKGGFVNEGKLDYAMSGSNICQKPRQDTDKVKHEIPQRSDQHDGLSMKKQERIKTLNSSSGPPNCTGASGSGTSLYQSVSRLNTARASSTASNALSEGSVELPPSLYQTASDPSISDQQRSDKRHRNQNAKEPKSNGSQNSFMPSTHAQSKKSSYKMDNAYDMSSQSSANRAHPNDTIQSRVKAQPMRSSNSVISSSQYPTTRNSSGIISQATDGNTRRQRPQQPDLLPNVDNYNQNEGFDLPNVTQHYANPTRASQFDTRPELHRHTPPSQASSYSQHPKPDSFNYNNGGYQENGGGPNFRQASPSSVPYTNHTGAYTHFYDPSGYYAMNLAGYGAPYNPHANAEDPLAQQYHHQMRPYNVHQMHHTFPLDPRFGYMPPHHYPYPYPYPGQYFFPPNYTFPGERPIIHGGMPPVYPEELPKVPESNIRNHFPKLQGSNICGLNTVRGGPSSLTSNAPSDPSVELSPSLCAVPVEEFKDTISISQVELPKQEYQPIPSVDYVRSTMDTPKASVVVSELPELPTSSDITALTGADTDFCFNSISQVSIEPKFNHLTD